MSPSLFKKSWEWYFFGTQADSPYGVFLNIHLYDLLDVLDLVDELHLCHRRYCLFCVEAESVQILIEVVSH